MSVVARAHRAVSEAAKPFESRWTLRALLAEDKELYHRFREQQGLWNAALVTGSEIEIADQTAAMCRGWHAIAQRMDEAGVPDNAYLIGVDEETGTQVAIGDQLATRDRVREVHGEKTIFLTPSEVATLLTSTTVITSLKNLFPGAELLEIRPS
jgi:hypothetical protein